MNNIFIKEMLKKKHQQKQHTHSNTLKVFHKKNIIHSLVFIRCCNALTTSRNLPVFNLLKKIKIKKIK